MLSNRKTAFWRIFIFAIFLHFFTKHDKLLVQLGTSSNGREERENQMIEVEALEFRLGTEVTLQVDKAGFEAKITGKLGKRWEISLQDYRYTVEDGKIQADGHGNILASFDGSAIRPNTLHWLFSNDIIYI